MSGIEDLNKRHAAIHADPELRAHLDRLRRGPVERIPMAVRFEQMRREKMREERKNWK